MLSRIPLLHRRGQGGVFFGSLRNFRKKIYEVLERKISQLFLVSLHWQTFL
jgi:hypothetical protein